MRPYSAKREPKGISGRRRSCDTPHRRRSLRTDKKAARRDEGPTMLTDDQLDAHNRTPFNLTLIELRPLWADLPDEQRMQMLLSLIWTAPDQHGFFLKVMMLLQDYRFEESFD